MRHSELNREHVTIAVIDSGISPGHAFIDEKVKSGVTISKDDGGAIAVLYDSYNDSIGHGTACAGIILKKAPNSWIFPIKVFENELVTDLDVLVRAISLAVDEFRVDIINLSLGTTDKRNVNKLKEICDYAVAEGSLIVAALNRNGWESYPACFDNVIGVGAISTTDSSKYYFIPGRRTDFFARGSKQRLCWINSRSVFLEGTSFSCPHITGAVASIIGQHPLMAVDGIMELLKQNASSNEELRGLEINGPVDHAEREHSPQSGVDFIMRALIYPYNKEMHPLVRFNDLTSFEVVHVLDEVGALRVGRDAGEIIGSTPFGKSVRSFVKYESLLEDSSVDTVIIGYVDKISELRNRNLLNELVALLKETFPEKIEFSLQVEPGLPSIQADPNQLHQVLLIFLINWVLAVIALAIVPFYLIGQKLFNYKIRQINNAKKEEWSRVGGSLQEILGGVLSIELYRREEYEIGRFDDKSLAAIALSKKNWLFSTYAGSINGFIQSISPIVILSIAGYFIMNGRMTTGELVGFVGYMSLLYGPSTQLFGFLTNLQSAVVSVDRIYDILEKEAEKDRPHLLHAEGTNAFKGEVRFQDVDFYYKEKSGDFQLKKFNLQISSGEKIGMVGRTGSGKTTLAYLLLRLYEPSGGRIFLDDCDIREYSLHELRRLIGIVPQETYIFSGTIAENIKYANVEAFDEEMCDAAKSSYADNFIKNLADGYDPIIGERGFQLTGGQKQIWYEEAGTFVVKSSEFFIGSCSFCIREDSAPGG